MIFFSESLTHILQALEVPGVFERPNQYFPTSSLGSPQSIFVMDYLEYRPEEIFPIALRQFFLESLLNRKLSAKELSQVDAAHLVGLTEIGADGNTLAGIGNYKQSHIRQKTKIVSLSRLFYGVS